MLAMQERLTEMFAENPQLSERVNIGFKSPSKDLSGEPVSPLFNSFPENDGSCFIRSHVWMLMLIFSRNNPIS
jgi:hypothetical protein